MNPSGLWGTQRTATKSLHCSELSHGSQLPRGGRHWWDPVPHPGRPDAVAAPTPQHAAALGAQEEPSLLPPAVGVGWGRVLAQFLESSVRSSRRHLHPPASPAQEQTAGAFGALSSRFRSTLVPGLRAPGPAWVRQGQAGLGRATGGGSPPTAPRALPSPTSQTGRGPTRPPGAPRDPGSSRHPPGGLAAEPLPGTASAATQWPVCVRAHPIS